MCIKMGGSTIMYSEREELLNKLIDIGANRNYTTNADNNKKHYVYVIHHKKTLKMYVGKRSCVGAVTDDPYMGSGILIKLAINKEGVDMFNKKILAQFNSEEEAYNFEAEIVDTCFTQSEHTYNIALGGGGIIGDEVVKRRLAKSTVEKYRTHPISRKDFNKFCCRRGLNVEDFVEVGFGKSASQNNGSRLYFFYEKAMIHKDDNIRKLYEKLLHCERDYMSRHLLDRYENNEVTRNSFKVACKSRGENIKDYIEIWSGFRLKDVVKGSKHNSRLFFYYSKHKQYSDVELVKMNERIEHSKMCEIRLANNNNNRVTIPLDTYIRVSTKRRDFINKCNSRGVCFDDYIEVFDTETYVKGKNKNFYYIPIELVKRKQ